MYASVPNHLEVEDVFVFNLSMCQAAVLFLGIAMGFAAWNDCQDLFVDPSVGFWCDTALATLIGVAALLITFVHVLSRTLDTWLIILFLYLIRPHTYVWRFEETLDRAEPEASSDQTEEEPEEW